MLQQELVITVLEFFFAPVITSLAVTFSLTCLFKADYIKVLIGMLLSSLVLYVCWILLGTFRIEFYYAFMVLEILYLFAGFVTNKAELKISSFILIITTGVMIAAFLGYIPKFWKV